MTPNNNPAAGEQQGRTAGPWKFDDTPGCRQIKGGKHEPHKKQSQYKEIACTVGLYDDGEDRANAAFIVTACNSYDSNMETIARLTEALEGLIAAEERFEDDTGIELDDLITDALVVAKSALASASQPEQKEGA